jgi:hypothetical protein
VDAPTLRGVLERQPAIVRLHALHVLAVDDAHQFADQRVGPVVEEAAETGPWTAGDGLVTLDKDVRARQRMQKPKSLHVLRQRRVEPAQADELDVVRRRRLQQRIPPADQIETARVVQSVPTWGTTRRP